MNYPIVKLEQVLSQRKGFITIDDTTDYKLCRVQTKRKGVVLRSILSGNEIKTKRQQLCKAGDFVVATIDAKVGGYGFIPEELNGAIASNDYQLYELQRDKIVHGYLEYLIKSDIIQDQIQPSGTTNHARTYAKTFLSYEIPLPDLPTQRKIADKFKKVVALKKEFSAEQNKIKTLLENLKQAVLQAAVTGKLVPQDPNDEPASELLKRIRAEKERLIKAGKQKIQKPLPPISPEEIPYELPQGWAWCRLGEITYNLGQKIPDKEFSYIDVASVNKEFGIDWPSVVRLKPANAPSRARKIVDSNCVIYSTVRPYLQNIAIVDNGNDDEIIASTAFSILKPYNGINKEYLYYYLFTPIWNDQTVNKMKGMAYPAINDKDLKSQIVAIPPINEQKQIVHKLNTLYANLCGIAETTKNDDISIILNYP